MAPLHVIGNGLRYSALYIICLEFRRFGTKKSSLSISAPNSQARAVGSVVQATEREASSQTGHGSSSSLTRPVSSPCARLRQTTWHPPALLKNNSDVRYVTHRGEIVTSYSTCLRGLMSNNPCIKKECFTEVPQRPISNQCVFFNSQGSIAE